MPSAKTNGSKRTSNMPSDENSPNESFKISVLRGAVESLSLYEITDYELEIFEKGSPASTFLNFSIFCFSVGITSGLTLMSVEISNMKVFFVYLVICVVGLLTGSVLIVLWWREGSSIRKICTKIRARLTEAIPEGTNPIGDGQNNTK